MQSRTPTRLTPIGLWRSRFYRWNFCAFVIFSLLFYGWMGLGSHWIPFDTFDYTHNAQHYVADERLKDPGAFNLQQAIGPYDGQWYLIIAAHSYTSYHFSMSYAFAPLLPLLIAMVDLVLHNVVLSAFVAAQLILLAIFWLVYWLVVRWYDEHLAAKTAWLLLLYPFSIFYRSYFSEGLFLLLLVACMDAMRLRRWLAIALAVGGLIVTRFAGIAAELVLAGQLWLHNPVRLTRRWAWVGLSLVPLAVFAVYCWVRSGDPLMFMAAQGKWFKPHSLLPGSALLWSVLHFWSLPWHSFHASKLDVLSTLGAGLLLYFARHWLPRVWWWLALLLWLIPVFTTDTMSASRFQIVNLPLFLYAAHRLRGWQYAAVLMGCTLGLLLVSLRFVDWHWVG